MVRLAVLLGVALAAGTASGNRCPAPPVMRMTRFSQPPTAGTRVPPGLLRTIEAEYVAKIRPIFEEKCFACHDPQQEMPWYGHVPVPWFGNPVERDVVDGRRFVNLTVDDVAPEGDAWLGPQSRIRAIRNVVEKRTMPPRLYAYLHPASRLTDDERALVLDWTGRTLERLVAAERTITERASPAVATGRLLRNRCTRCHNQDLPGEDGRVFPFTDLAALRADPVLVGDPPTAGKLHEVVEKGEMPPKDLDDPLTDEERQRLLAWIEKGAAADPAREAGVAGATAPAGRPAVEEGGSPDDGAPEGGSPDDGAPQDGASDDGVPQDGAP